jgi:hypothetical protein
VSDVFAKIAVSTEYFFRYGFAISLATASEASIVCLKAILQASTWHLPDNNAHVCNLIFFMGREFMAIMEFKDVTSRGQFLGSFVLGIPYALASWQSVAFSSTT